MVLLGESKPIISLEKINKARKSICKIIIKGEKNSLFRTGTGFFMKISDNLKYLITYHHIINQEVLNKNIELEIWNEKKMKLTFDERFIKYFQDPSDITAIEINEKDNIYEDIIFLDYDSNFINGKSISKNEAIFSIYYYHNKKPMISLGKIKSVINENKFLHNINTEKGSSGGPIILSSNLKVIGVHIGNIAKKEINLGNFIDKIIKEICISNKTSNDLQSLDKNKIVFDNNNSKILSNNLDNSSSNNKIKGDYISNNFTDNLVNINKNKNLINNNNNNINNNLKINLNQNLNNNNFNQNNINFTGNINIYLNNNQSLNNNSGKIMKNNNSIKDSINSDEVRKKENLLVLSNDSKDVITLHFQSSDQSLNYAVRCKNTDKFNMVMNKILEKEPKIIEKEFYFISKGSKIKEYKSIKDNNLKEGDAVILQIYDE